MTSGTRARMFIAALALCAPATIARAVTPPTQATVNANIIHPLTVTKLKDMDFGYLAAATAGTAVLEPNADAFSTTGGATAVGGTAHCAEFLGAAQSNAVVNIQVPKQPITLTARSTAPAARSNSPRLWSIRTPAR